MAYFNYHGKIKKLIKEGKLVKYEIVDEYHKIKPCLVLFFADGQCFPIREYRFHEYFILIDENHR